MSDPKAFKSLLNEGQIVEAIRNAESKTSAEIRVFISNKPTDEPVAAAQAALVSLGMNRTAARNGVLIFVAPCSKKFAVIGDAGIHEKCGNPFWQQVAVAMTGYFQKSEFTAGIIHGIARAGEILATHFPRQSDDKNELPDEIAHD